MQYKWTVLTVTTVGVLMSGIDGRIVVIGLPTIAAALHADAEQAIWFTQAYLVGSTVALLFIGRVSDIVGRVRVYTLGFVIFTIGSALTSISATPDAFIASRIFQGIGSAALFANSAAIVTDAFPSGELGRALGINSVAFRVGSMLGLTLSGLILAVLDWRFLFYINIPVGVFGTLWAHRRLKESGRLEKGTPMDWSGFGVFTVFITSFLLTLTFAAYGTSDWLPVAALGAVSIVSLAGFVLLETRTSYPLLDLKLLRIREYAGGVVTQLVNAMAWGAFILLLSLYLELVKGLSPLDAGLSILPFDVVLLVFAPLSGRLSDRYGTRPFTTVGLVVVSVSLFAFSTLGVSTPYPTLVGFLVLTGAGMGLFVSPNMSSIMGSVPPEQRGVASGLRATFFNIGFTISFNIVILVLSFYVGYSLITSIISSPSLQGVTLADLSSFMSGLDNVYRILAVVNTAAIVPSLLRGKRVAYEGARAAGSNTEEGLPVD